MIVIQQRVPLVLLKDTKANALNLRAIRTAVVTLPNHVFIETVALVLVVLGKRVD